MFDLFFSSHYGALSALACSLQKPFLDATYSKAIKKEDARSSLVILAASPATFCTQPIRQANHMVFRHQWFSKSCSFPFKSGFRHSNQSAKNVTSVTSVTTKTAFSQKLVVTTFDVSLQGGWRQLVKACIECTKCTKCTKCTIRNHFFAHFPSLDAGCVGSKTAFFKKVPLVWIAITCFTWKNLQRPWGIISCPSTHACNFDTIY
jgi:hypothetical protein